MRLRRPAKSADHLSVQIVLSDLDASMKSLGCVVRHYRDFALRNDVAMINLLVDIMDGTAGLFLTGLERLFPGKKSRKLRQKRRMNVYDSTGKRL